MVAGKSAEGGAHRRRRRQRRHGGDVADLDLLRRRWLDEEARECKGGGGLGQVLQISEIP
jgi:hypothetical protein